MQQTKAQNALEFLAMLSVLLLMFTALFGFVLGQYGNVLIQKDQTTMSKVLEDIQSEIRQALFAPDGYTRSFFVDDKAIATAYNLSIRSGAEIFVNDSRGYQQILFLKSEEYVRGTLCTRQNQIIKSADYGIGLCCNSCGGVVPGVSYTQAIECKTNNSVYWDACTNMTRSSNWTQLRVNCSLWMTAANFTIYNQSGSQLIALNMTSTNVTVRNLSISWVSLTLPTSVRLGAATYNVSAICYNATSWYNQTGTFTIS